MANHKNIPTIGNTPIPIDFLTSLGNALGDKLGDVLIKLFDKVFPADDKS